MEIEDQDDQSMKESSAVKDDIEAEELDEQVEPSEQNID